MRPTTPPRLDEVLAALGSLPDVPSHARQLVALHLSLPYGVVPGIEVREEAGSLVWRDASVSVGNGVSSAVLLSSLGWEDGDEFLDLSGDPQTWVKPVVSGTSCYTFGTDILFGKPLLRLPVTWSKAEVAEAVRALRLDEIAPGMMFKGEPVREYAGCLSVGSFKVETGGRSGDIPAAMASLLGGTLLDGFPSVCVLLNSGAVITIPGVFDEFSFRSFPIEVHDSSASALVEGFTSIGLNAFGDSVLRHDQSGTRVILLS